MGAVDQATTGGYLERYDEALARDPMSAFGLVREWMRTDWRALFAELRERRPVFVTPAFTVVTRFADVVEVLSREEVFSVRAFGPRLDAALGAPFMLGRDATPMNWRDRGLMQVMLDPRDAAGVRETAGRIADEMLDAARPHGRVEAVHALFRPVALGVCAEYFGFPGPDPQTLSRWTRAVVTDGFANFQGDPEVRAASVRAGSEMMGYLRGRLAEYRTALRAGRDLPDDVFGRLAGTVLPAGIGVDDERILVNMAGLPLGFVESAPGAMVEAVEQLLLRPRVLAQAVEAAADPERFDRYVWEALRFNPFFKLLPRMCERDHVLAAGTPRGTVIPAGTLVLAAPASAMFDADVVAEPDEFRLDRPDHHRLFFGHGHHACLGVHIARVVVCEAVRRLLLRPGVRLLPRPEGQVVRAGGIFPDRFVLGLDSEGREVLGAGSEGREVPGSGSEGREG
ncbi:cytochrome P450 [Streptosporangium becharense]|uniref:Cytochrome P450 n=1 Tax=Streptosporangium becharense TaxID=1816182 RepID=A0A7W9II34_9ACTN|nr:cytochrome P450 [Streptosporangium becharense]MBB2912469.1 cytochrome P450 [Streptosporangium becharense]MBB5820701.1 cytochrome P450 [Streptosporangium becharense]